MKDNDYYGFFVPMDLKRHDITVDSSNPMTVDSSNDMYPLNDFSIRNLYIEVSEIYKPKTVTFYIYDDMDVKMMKADSSVIYIYNKADNSDGKYPYKTEIKTIDGVDYILELPLHADIALIGGHKADASGNLRYIGSERNFNPMMAMAADCFWVKSTRPVAASRRAPM